MLTLLSCKQDARKASASDAITKLYMTTSQTEVESLVTELATEAFKTFCNDVSGMFGVDAECEQREISNETIPGLKKRFNKLIAVNVIESEGILNGTFQFIFDEEGLFTLGGIIAALPEETIMSNRNNASDELAEGMTDAIGEAGNHGINSRKRWVWPVKKKFCFFHTK